MYKRTLYENEGKVDIRIIRSVLQGLGYSPLPMPKIVTYVKEDVRISITPNQRGFDADVVSGNDDEISVDGVTEALLGRFKTMHELGTSRYERNKTLRFRMPKLAEMKPIVPKEEEVHAQGNGHKKAGHYVAPKAAESDLDEDVEKAYRPSRPARKPESKPKSSEHKTLETLANITTQSTQQGRNKNKRYTTVDKGLPRYEKRRKGGFVDEVLR